MGIGSSDITNWARAVSVIVPSEDKKTVFEFKHVKRGRRTGSDGIICLKQGKDHKDIFWYATDKPAKVVKTQKGDGRKSPNSNPLYYKLQLETLPPMTKADLLSHIKSKLSKLGEPCADSDVVKIFCGCRKTYMVFSETTKLWSGKLYIPECTENKASEGGTL